MVEKPGFVRRWRRSWLFFAAFNSDISEWSAMLDNY